MAASMTITEYAYEPIKKIKAVWTSSAGGAVSSTTVNKYTGRLVGAITVPDGTSAPTDLYDIAINDSDGVDVALGALANRSATATEFVAEASMAAVAQSALTIAVSNAGDTKKGTIYLFID
jgi:hypothetical protein